MFSFKGDTKLLKVNKQKSVTYLSKVVQLYLDSSLAVNQLLNPIRPGGGLRGPDDQTHSCQSETSYSMTPKLGDF